MAVEREISSSLDLTKEKAVIEYVELREYRKSENWTFPVIEKIERRMRTLAEIVMNLAIKDKEKERNNVQR